MVSKAKMKRVMPKRINHKVTPIGYIGKEPLVLPNYSGVKRSLKEGHQSIAEEGSILFSDGKNIAEDNFNLFWDAAKNQLEPNLIKITSDGTQASPALKFNDTNTGFYKSGDSIRLSLNNSTKMTVNSTGFGIGTTTPSNKLEIAGVDSNYLTGPHIRLTTDADVYPEMQLLGFTHDNIYLLFDVYLLNGTWKSSDAGSNFNINKSGDKLNFQYDSGVAQGSTVNWNDGITMNTSGKVGIGTTTPNRALHINNTVAALKLTDPDDTGYFSELKHDFNVLEQRAGNEWRLFTGAAGGSERVRVSSAGNLGIGTSVMNGKFNVGGGDCFVLNPAGNPQIVIGDSTNDFIRFRYNSAANYGVFESFDGGSATKTIINPEGGDVGIGTLIPNAKLDVRGNMSQSELTQTFSGTKILTSGSATGFFEAAIATGELIGGNVIYTIKVDNGTDLQCHMGAVGFVGVNKAGTVTCASDETYSPSSEIEVKTSGTLTDVFDCTAGTGKMTVRCNATTNLGGTPVITIDYTITMHSLNTITAL